MKSAVLVTISLAAALGVSLGGTIGGSARAAEGVRVDLVDRTSLRVCADPANMPFSNEKGEGFENKIAEIVASELKVPVSYVWFPQAIGFIRQTLFARRCDVVIGYAQGDELVLNTNHYYRSVYTLVYRKGNGPAHRRHCRNSSQRDDGEVGPDGAGATVSIDGRPSIRVAGREYDRRYSFG